MLYFNGFIFERNTEVLCYFVLEHVPASSSASLGAQAATYGTWLAEEPHQAMKGIARLLLPGHIVFYRHPGPTTMLSYQIIPSIVVYISTAWKKRKSNLLFRLFPHSVRIQHAGPVVHVKSWSHRRISSTGSSFHWWSSALNISPWWIAICSCPDEVSMAAQMTSSATRYEPKMLHAAVKRMARNDVHPCMVSFRDGWFPNFKSCFPFPCVHLKTLTTHDHKLPCSNYHPKSLPEVSTFWGHMACEKLHRVLD